jgi:hypothetical protein
VSVASEKVFVIRRSFLLPLGLLLLETLVLLVVCLVQQQPLAKALILLVLILPIAGLFVESLFRKLTLEADGVRAKRMFREKVIRFAEMPNDRSSAARARTRPMAEQLGFVTMYPFPPNRCF